MTEFLAKYATSELAKEHKKFAWCTVYFKEMRKGSEF